MFFVQRAGGVPAAASAFRPVTFPRMHTVRVHAQGVMALNPPCVRRQDDLVTGC